MRTSTLSGLASLLIALIGGGVYVSEFYPRVVLRSVLDQTIASLPPGTTASYRDARYSLITRKAQVMGITLHGSTQTNPPEPLELTIQTVRSARPNLQLADAWNKTLATGDVNTAVPVADDIVLEGVALTSPTITATIDSLHIAKPRAYPARYPHDLPKQLREAATAKPDAPPSLDALTALLSRSAAAAILGIAHGKYDMAGLTVTSHAQGFDLHYTIQMIHGGALEQGRFADGTVEHMTMSSPTTGEFSVNKMTTGGMDMRRPLTRLADGEPPSLALLDGLRIGRTEYTGVMTHPPGQAPVEIAAMWVGPVSFDGGLPVSGAVGWRDLKLTKAGLPDLQARMAFEAMGLDTATVSANAAYDWDVAHHKLTIHDTMLSIKELGTLSVNVNLDGIVPNPILTLARGRLVHGQLRLEDASLTDRLIKIGAGLRGVDPDEYRRQIAAFAKLGVLGAEPGSVLSQLGGPVADFIAAPRSLTLDLSPAKPMPLLTLRDQVMAVVAAPNKAAADFGISAVANGP
jgi:hypothetical protein